MLKKKKETLAVNLKGDRWIWIIIVLLCVCSLLAVFSSSSKYYLAGSSGPFHFVGRQAFYLCLSLAIAYMVHRIHYLKWAMIANLAYVLVFVLLVITLFWGVEINGAKRWLRIPLMNFTFQTSDLAKLVLVIFTAKMISLKQDDIKNFKKGLLPVFIPIFLYTLLVTPYNLSTGVLVFGVGIIMMIVGRVRVRQLMFVGVIFVGLLGVLQIFEDKLPRQIRYETWGNRIEKFSDETKREEFDHTMMNKLAIANGTPFGQGPGNGFQSSRIPYANADSIYAAIIEEWGLIGGFFVLALYVLLFVRCVLIVHNTPKVYSAMLVIGLSLNIVLTAFVNMAVAVDLIPVTGQTLPMISMGGSSIVILGVTFGIILSVSKYIKGTDEEDIIRVEKDYIDQKGISAAEG